MELKTSDFNHSEGLFSIAKTKNWDFAAVKKLVYCLSLLQTVDFNYQDEKGNTFFHQLILNQRSSKDITSLLKIVCETNAKFDANIQNLKGDTFFHTALKSDFLYVKEMIPMLDPALQQGFNMKIENEDGKTIFDCLHDLQFQMLQNTIRVTKYLKAERKGKPYFPYFVEEPSIDSSELELVLLKKEIQKKR